MQPGDTVAWVEYCLEPSSKHRFSVRDRRGVIESINDSIATIKVQADEVVYVRCKYLHVIRTS